MKDQIKSFEAADYLDSEVVIAAEILRQLDLVSENDLIDLSPMPVKNRRDDIVGKVEASFHI